MAMMAPVESPDVFLFDPDGTGVDGNSVVSTGNVVDVFSILFFNRDKK